jgi:hypothetical protein
MNTEKITALVAEAIAPIAGNNVDKDFYHEYGLKCGLAAAQAVLAQMELDEKSNGWKIERYDGQYIYLSFDNKPGELQIKACDEGFVIDAFQTGVEDEPVFTAAVEYTELCPDYSFDFSPYAKEGATSISDIRLGHGLEFHRFKNQSIDLLEAQINALDYKLVIAGCLNIIDLSTDKSALYGDALTVDIIDFVESEGPENTKYSIDSSPWFEWIDVDGNSVGDIFDTIDLDPFVEIQKLQQLLGSN